MDLGIGFKFKTKKFNLIDKFLNNFKKENKDLVILNLIEKAKNEIVLNYYSDLLLNNTNNERDYIKEFIVNKENSKALNFDVNLTVTIYPYKDSFYAFCSSNDKSLQSIFLEKKEIIKFDANNEEDKKAFLSIFKKKEKECLSFVVDVIKTNYKTDIEKNLDKFLIARTMDFKSMLHLIAINSTIKEEMQKQNSSSNLVLFKVIALTEYLEKNISNSEFDINFYNTYKKYLELAETTLNPNFNFEKTILKRTITNKKV